MKKLISIMAILFLSFALFAQTGISVKAGGAFSFVTGTSNTSETITNEKEYSINGFGFDIGADFSLSKVFFAWLDFNMVFPKDTTVRETSYSESKSNLFSVSAGFSFKLDLNSPIILKAGLGGFFERGSAKISDSEKYGISNIGAALLLDAKYPIVQNIGIGLALMPRVGIYNMFSQSVDNADAEAKGVKISFSMPIIASLSYTF